MTAWPRPAERARVLVRDQAEAPAEMAAHDASFAAPAGYGWLVDAAGTIARDAAGARAVGRIAA